MASDDKGQHRLDEETIALGRANLELIRQQLRAPKPADPPQPVQREKLEAAVADELSADRIEAEMAAGAHRDWLVARVEHLEAEVGQLRAALASVLDAASSGLRAATDLTDETPR